MHLLSLVVLALANLVSAQFGFFDHMFSSGGQQHRQPQNVPSDSSQYRTQYSRSHCDKYLCPDTLGRPSLASSTLKGRWLANTGRQRASTSPTTAHANGRRTRTNSNSLKGSGSASLRAGSRLERRRERSSWRAKASYDTLKGIFPCFMCINILTCQEA